MSQSKLLHVEKLKRIYWCMVLISKGGMYAIVCFLFATVS